MGPIATLAAALLAAATAHQGHQAHAASAPREGTLAHACVSARAPVFTGKVRSVADGDTLVVEDGHRQRVRVRLSGIDAPELAGHPGRSQPYGQRARRALSQRVYRRQVRVEWHVCDDYGRVVGRVLLDGEDVGLRQVCDGYAWVYRQYLDDLPAQARVRYLRCERKAREDGVGLWAGSRPVPPWEWRHRRKGD
jgi:endonuclease YncB( thermonuclease family)